MVARLREIARSQMAGRARNTSGGISVNGPGRLTASSKHPINPMSWYSGNHDTPACASSPGTIVSMAAMFASTLECVKATGLGSTVVPLENWMRSRSLGFERTADGCRVLLLQRDAEAILEADYQRQEAHRIELKVGDQIVAGARLGREAQFFAQHASDLAQDLIHAG